MCLVWCSCYFQFCVMRMMVCAIRAKAAMMIATASSIASKVMA